VKCIAKAQKCEELTKKYEIAYRIPWTSIALEWKESMVWYITIATASFSTDSPNTRLYRFLSAPISLHEDRYAQSVTKEFRQLWLI